MITTTAQTIRDAWVCSWCKAVCNNTGVLCILTPQQYERTLKKDSQANHGICNGCEDNQRQEIAKRRRKTP